MNIDFSVAFNQKEVKRMGKKLEKNFTNLQVEILQNNITELSINLWVQDEKTYDVIHHINEQVKIKEIDYDQSYDNYYYNEKENTEKITKKMKELYLELVKTEMDTF